MYDIEHMPQSIEIGFTGEMNFRKIEIDMSAWMALMPDGVPSIVHIRPGETTENAYITATTFEDNILTWEVTAGDIGETEGTGLAQIWLEAEANESVIKRGKSTLVSTIVRLALNDPSDVVPEAQTAWLEAMTGIKTETVAAKEAAEAAQTAAETAQSEAESARDLAQTSQEAAYTSESNAASYATDAEGHVAEAASYATDAFTAKAGAEEARDEVFGMSVTASGLPAGAAPTVSFSGGVMSFGIPKGDPGSSGSLPPGGVQGQILTKQSADDGDADWENAPDPTGKADKVSGATEGNFAGLDENGNLTDSGHKHSDYLTQHQDITGKADKVSAAVSGNFAGLDSNGNLVDSGHKHSDYVTAQDISGKTDKVTGAVTGNFAGLDANGNLTDSGHKHSDYLTAHQDISGKADKVSSATADNFAGLDGNGNLTDSGYSGYDIDNIEDGMAIVADGDIHKAIASGQYVYVKNHSTLTSGMYKATAAIAADGALTTSNLTVCSDGGFNDLYNNLASVIATVEIGTASGLSSTEKEVNLSESMANFVLIAFCIGWQNTGSGFIILPSEYASWSEPKRVFLNNNPSSAYAIIKSNSGSPTKLNVSATDTNILLRVLGIMRKS